MEQTRYDSSISSASPVPLQGPLHWYGRKISNIAHCPQTVCEAAVFIANLVQVFFLSPSLLLILPLAAIGYGAWHFSNYFSSAQAVEPPQPPPSRFPPRSTPIDPPPPISDNTTSGDGIVEDPGLSQDLPSSEDPPSSPPISDNTTSEDDIVEDPGLPQDLPSSKDSPSSPSIPDNTTSEDDIVEDPGPFQDLPSSDVPPSSPPISDRTTSGGNIVEDSKLSQDLPLREDPLSSPSISGNTNSEGDIVEDPELLQDLPPSDSPLSPPPTSDSTSSDSDASIHEDPINLPPPIGEETLKILRADGCELQNLVEKLCRDLKQIEGDLGKELEEKLIQFETRYSQYRSMEGTDKPFAIFDESKHLFEISRRSHRAYFEYLEAQGADHRGVIPQLKDGNCWLHTALCGLQYLGKGEGFDHINLREMVVQWMRANYDLDPTLREALHGNEEGMIVGAIDAHKDVESFHIQREQESLEAAKNDQLITQSEFDEAVQFLQARKDILANFTLEDYFEHMSQLGSHGSRAELYAISQIFEVHVKIWFDGREGLSSDFYPPIINLSLESNEWIHVVLNQEGNHFDYLVSEDITLSATL